jgi:hypothetical protein
MVVVPGMMVPGTRRYHTNTIIILSEMSWYGMMNDDYVYHNILTNLSQIITKHNNFTPTTI